MNLAMVQCSMHQWREAVVSFKNIWFVLWFKLSYCGKRSGSVLFWSILWAWWVNHDDYDDL